MPKLLNACLMQAIVLAFAVCPLWVYLCIVRPSYAKGEIAIFVPTFDLSYLRTNLLNYGTIIYPIMVIRAPLLQ